MNSSTQRHLVLCEGKEDRLVLMALVSHLGISEHYRFESYAESGSLRSFLRLVKTLPDFTDGTINSILVTRDADSSYDDAWRSVSDGIREVFDISLTGAGVWCPLAETRKIAGWVIPGPDRTGMIESLLLDAERERGSEIFQCVDSVMDCAEKVYGKALHEKARFYIWTILAQEPGAKDRLILERALKRMPPDWESDHFKLLSGILRSALEK